MGNIANGGINKKGLTTAQVLALIAASSTPLTVQGTAAAPIIVTNASTIVLDPANDEDIYLASNSGAVTLTSANFSGTKAQGKNLRLIGKSDTPNTVTINMGGTLIGNGNRILSNHSIIGFRSDTVNLEQVSDNNV